MFTQLAEAHYLLYILDTDTAAVRITLLYK